MDPRPTSPEYPRLPRSWKKRYTFRLACPSFVYPADYDVNVDRLGPHVDDIELLFFEGQRESRPSAALVDRLAVLGQRHAVGFNVHLPTDLPLLSEDDQASRNAAATIKTMTQILAPLKPRFFVLHLEIQQPSRCMGPRSWQACAARALGHLIAEGCPLQDFRVENHIVPLDWFAPLVEAFNLDLCLDVGHLHLAGGDLAHTLDRWQERIRALHIHGVSDGHDHRALSCLSARDRDVLAEFLKSFVGSVTVEIFSIEGLCESLLLLDDWMNG